MNIEVCVGIISILIIYVCMNQNDKIVAKDNRSHLEKIDAMLLSSENNITCWRSSVRDL